MLNPGDLYGKYQIERILAVADFATVYEARHVATNSRVALKIVHRLDGAKATKDRAQWLESERIGTELQRQLPRHAALPSLFECGEIDGDFFVAMEFVGDESLNSILQKKPLRPEHAARVALVICDVIDTLQSRSIVHGDIKPSNIFVGANAKVTLTDFGIAKMLGPEELQTPHSFGSPSYCSPERLQNASVDLWSDLWSLGITFYEMITGVPPFQAESTQKLEKLIMSNSKTFRPRWPAGCPEEIKRIIRKLLEFRRQDRYQLAIDVIEDLEKFLRKSDITRPTVGIVFKESDFEMAFDPTMSAQEVTRTLRLFANYFRACGGVGLAVDFEFEEAAVTEVVDA